MLKQMIANETVKPAWLYAGGPDLPLLYDAQIDWAVVQ